MISVNPDAILTTVNHYTILKTFNPDQILTTANPYGSYQFWARTHDNKLQHCQSLCDISSKFKELINSNHLISGVCCLDMISVKGTIHHLKTTANSTNYL